MNRKKIIILAILFVIVVGLALSPVNAANETYKTGKLYFKYNGDSKSPCSEFTKSIDSKNQVYGFYIYPNNKNTYIYPANFMGVGTEGKYTKKGQYKPNYKPTKATVMFKKTVKGKTHYSSKTFTKFYKDFEFSYISGYEPKNNYKPYYAIVHYKKI